MILYPHQSKLVKEIFLNLQIYTSVLVQSATGSGKTVVMCKFISEYIEKNPDHIIIVSVHREELVQQTSLTLANFGIMNERITAKSKPNQIAFSNVYVGMTQTIYSRKTSFKGKKVVMVIDEAHEQIHNKTFGFFDDLTRIAFTATPVINQTITYFECNYCETKFDFQDSCCYNEPTQKWTKSVTMSQQYQNIILGPSIRWLIDEGFLVDEVVFDFNFYENIEDLDDEDEIAIESVKHDSQVLKEYIEKAEGKKTMIFTASTKQNKSLVKTFQDAGYNIMSYDSVHNKSTDRKNVVDWFKNTDGAILVSTGTFTTGFDVKEVECVIVNRPTKSLSLWHQMVGRGGRTSTLIFKENFIVIDLGGNSARFGYWSDLTDWKDIFYNGLKKPKKKKEELIQCDKCGYNWIGVNGDSCPDCSHTNIIQSNTNSKKEEKELHSMDQTTKAKKEIPLPNPQKIADFVIRTTNQKKDYFKIIIDRYADLFKLNRVSKNIYLQRIQNNVLEEKILDYIKRMYSFHSRIKNGQPRTYSYLIEKIKDKLATMYK